MARPDGGLVQRFAAVAALLLLAAAAPGPAAAQAAGGSGGGPPPFTPSPGQASVKSGQALLQALQSGTGDITLTGPIILSQNVWAQFQLPIVIQPNSFVRIHRVDPSILGLRQERIDWGGAMDLIEISTNGSLRLDGIISEHPGNFTRGLELVPLKVNGSFLWPTITSWPGSSLTISNSTISNDDPGCSPETTQAAVLRVQSFLPPELAGVMKYEGGTTVSYTYLPYPSPVYNITSRQVLGTSNFTLESVINTCFNSLVPEGSGSKPAGSSSSSGGGAPSWVWAVVGLLAGCALLAAVGGALLWRRARARRGTEPHTEDLAAAAAAAAASEPTKELSGDVEAGGGSGGSGSGKRGGGGKAGGAAAQPVHSQQALYSTALLPSVASFKGSQTGGSGSGGLGSGDLHAALMRTRFGVIEDLQLGELLGRGAFGRVYKGRWKGALVAVKVIEHRVQPGKTHDLSREPLLSMSISHPNIIATHQVMVLRLLSVPPSQGMEGDEAVLEALVASARSTDENSGSGRRLQGPGSGGQVEAVSPADVLQPGMYETWLVEEYCDRGNLADLISSGKHVPPDPAQHRAWALLCLLDIAIGLHYLHRAGIVHGDLKPHNVMLKSTRTDRRGFTCKLIDFGLSRTLGGEQTHIQTKSYGTASYAAPELLTQGKLSSASDIYSLGLIMWQLSCTAELHEGMSPMQIIVQVSQHGLRPEVPEGCPPALLSLMQRAWQDNPGSRPTAGQVVEELREQLTALAPPRPGGRRPAAQLSPQTAGGAHPAPAAQL